MTQKTKTQGNDAAGTLALPCSIPCNLCDSTDVDEVSLKERDGSYLRTVICRRCGLVWSDPRPAPEQVREYYQHNYRLDYKATWQPRPKHVFRGGRAAISRFRRLAPLLRPGWRVLDLGAGGGEVVYVLRAMGYDASGFEPNEGYAKFASETLGLPVRHGFYQDAQIPPQSQDMVTMFHVLEHLEDPRGVLKRIRDWLKPDGLLLIEVPNVEAQCQWPRSRFHRAHLYNFSPATLQKLGQRAGYSVVNSSVSSDGGNLTVVLRRSENNSDESGAIPTNYERVISILRGHTTVKHAFSSHAYARPIRKVMTRLKERKATRALSIPKEILDHLIASELSQNKRATEANSSDDKRNS